MYLVSISDFDEGILCELTSLLKPMGFYRHEAEQQPYHPLLFHSSVFVIYLYMFIPVIFRLVHTLLASWHRCDIVTSVQIQYKETYEESSIVF